ncbi:MAG: choice-of-anchor D domain-containing protein [Acidobacteria bacterium]|nr:choice-of-anchor D domain-containing protein [Acidobacteriota bacterium]
MAEETWTVSTLPFPVNDGGVAWLPGRPSGLYVAQGEDGTQFTRLVGAPAWLRVVPDAGSVPSGGASVLDVTFDSSPLLGGDYAATIEIRSNDPDTPLVEVPADLTVIGVPDIELRGGEQQLESAIDYIVDGALTRHALTIAVPPAGDGSIELIADGDYGDSSEVAAATAEGLPLGSVGATGVDCTSAAGLFQIGSANLADLAADGVVRVDVQNSPDVNVFCAANRHTIRLRYRAAADRLDFGAFFIGLSQTLELEVRNGGSSPLEVSSITSDRPEFVALPASLSLAPRATALVTVTFSPGAAQSFDGTLTLASNDPDEPLTTVAMHGEGLVPPEITVDPSSLAVGLFTGETTERTLTIANGGGDVLRWTAEIETAAGGRVLSASPVFAGVEPLATPPKESLPTAESRPPADQLYAANVAATTGSPSPDVAGLPPDPLEDVLLALDTGFGEITSLIPNRFDFSEGESGYYISDGGDDMYDSGNLLLTDLGSYLTYSNGSIQGSGLLGPTGRYFTRKHPGLFVLAADLDGVSEFTISGNLGADGSGSVDGVVLETTVLGTRYRGFVKRVFNAGDPSVNHLVIVPYGPAIDQDFAIDTNNDYHRVFGLPGAQRIYYLLYASSNGGYVDDATTLSIMESFLELFTTGWLRIAPDSGEVAPGASAALAVAFDASSLDGGLYPATIQIRSNDPIAPLVSVPTELTVTGAPDIAVEAGEQQLESAINYAEDGALTRHALTVFVTPGSDGSIELVADGDYGDSPELATASAEGLALGTVGALGSDCSPATERFPITAADLLSLAADGVVRVDVQNSPEVNVFCATNRHSVRLRYRGAGDRLDFGALFLGLSRTLELEVRNEGTQQLEVLSIASDRPEFVPSVPSLSLAPRTSAILAVTFAPGSVQSFDGTLTLTSNDPDESDTVVTLAGVGIEPPIIGVAPPELDATLNQFVRSTQPLTVSNSGGSALDFTVEVLPRGPGLERVAFAGLAAGDGPSDDPESSMSDAEQGEPPPFRGEDATFEPLPPSPVPLSCLSGDVAGRAIYARASSGYGFYRFRPDTVAWERLADFPVYSYGSAGAASLGGTIFVSHASWGVELGVYDIGTDTWTTRPHPVLAGTANVASDGARYLYFVEGQQLVRYEPATWGKTSLSSPPFSLGLAGGLAYSGGRLYGHAADGSKRFAVYDVASDTWRELPRVPAEAVSGAAIDPLAQEYAAVGPYGGKNLYRFSLIDETWTVSTLPFEVRSSGLTWQPGRPAGLYIAQGAYANGFTRQVGTPAWLRVAPDAGSVATGATAALDVTLDSNLLLGGDHAATIEIRSNDPLAPRLEVPVDLTVIEVPDIALSGVEQQLESAIDYTVYGALTEHALTIVVPPADEGSIELIAEGDFGSYSSRATASAEGLPLGSVGESGWDCAPASGRFEIGASNLRALAADGIVRVRVQNDYSVDPSCLINRHTVRLRYRGAADLVDFGAQYLGLPRTLEIRVSNRGSSSLEVSSIASDRAEFVASPAALSLAPHTSALLSVTFTPGAVRSFDGTLTLASNDPDEAVTVVTLAGLGIEPPLIGVDPAELDATLDEGTQVTLPLTVSNSGASVLDFTAEVVPRGPGLQRMAFAGLSAGDGQSDNSEPSVSGTELADPPSFRGEAVSVEPLPASPAPLTCVAGDVAARVVYAQENQGVRFYRFRSETGVWESLASAPINSGNNGGATLLQGTIYTTYPNSGPAGLGAYDIATDSWTTRPHPLRGTANVANDGERYLYFALGQRLVRYEPATLEAVDLAAPPFAFEPWGGLAYSDGRLYGHAGNGRSEFAVYDVAHDTWRPLAPVPAGAVLGAAIDRLAQEYVAVGPSGGTNLYRFSLTEETWAVSTLPFPVRDGGLAWLPGRPAGTHLVQGEYRTGFARLVGAPAWLRVSPEAGSVATGQASVLDVAFDSSLLLGGDYGAAIELRSNDPLTPRLEVPVDLTVIGVPDIELRGVEQRLESVVDYTRYSALTQHSFPIVAPPASDGSIELLAEGEYGYEYAQAAISAEGRPLGVVGAIGSRCAPAAGRFPVGAADLLALAADGVVRVDVQNSNYVEPYCPINRHTVRLRYRGAAERVDFGVQFVGLPRILEIEVINRGSSPLEISSIASDRPEFAPSATSLTLASHASANLTLTFTPGAVQTFDGTLTLVSNDPDEAVTTVALSGQGVEAPVIGVDPADLDATIAQGAKVTVPLAVSNSGGSALDFATEIVPSGPGMQRVKFAGLSAGEGQADDPESAIPGADQAEPTPFHGADATFELLPASPVPLTCIVGDAAEPAIYAQAISSRYFYRFRPDRGIWERLADAPVDSYGAAGAARLGGTIYTSYASSYAPLGIYEIAANSWTTCPHPLGGGTANVASDGDRYLYFVQGQRLARYEPATLVTLDLAAPPFEFEARGGLAYSEGRLYGHAGGGRSDFAVYDVASDTWRRLTSVPGGALLGAAIDPLAQEYSAVGPSGGTNLYRFSLTNETWTVSTLPFAVRDGGLAWLPGQPKGLYLVQGDSGTGFTRLVGAPAWLRFTPDVGQPAARGGLRRDDRDPEQRSRHAARRGPGGPDRGRRAGHRLGWARTAARVGDRLHRVRRPHAARAGDRRAAGGRGLDRAGRRRRLRLLRWASHGERRGLAVGERWWNRSELLPSERLLPDRGD